MHAQHRSIAEVEIVHVHGTAPTNIRARLIPSRQRSLVDNIFADEIVVCMIEARPPTGLEIQTVAARIWAEVQAGGVRIAWHDIVPGDRRYRRMIAAARAALGDGRKAPRSDKPP